MTECESCGNIAECESIETNRATLTDPADGVYLCRPCLERGEEADEAAQERRAEERTDREYDDYR